MQTYKFANIGDLKMHYDEQGTGDALVLIHAGIADLRMWDKQMSAFSKNYRVIRYDVRGFGQTPCPKMDYRDHDDLKALLESLGVRRTHVLGISNGGGIAIDFALTYPGIVNRLILVAPALRGYDGPQDPFDTMMYKEFDRLIAAGDTVGAAEIEARVWADGPNRKPEQVDPEFREWALELITHKIEIGPGEGQSYMARPAAATRLNQIKSPTMLIMGKEDIVGMFDVTKALESGIPNLTRVDLPGTAHLPPMEKPEEFNRIVLDFMQSK